MFYFRIAVSLKYGKPTEDSLSSYILIKMMLVVYRKTAIKEAAAKKDRVKLEAEELNYQQRLTSERYLDNVTVI